MENNIKIIEPSTDSRIFVHGGMSHMDEILAVAFLWLLVPTMRFILPKRVMALPADFRPGVDWALDIGEKLEPSANIFDHHQKGSEDGHSAFSLLVRHLDPELFAFLDADPFPGTPSWFKTARLVDSKGPFWFKKEFGVLPGDMWGSILTMWFTDPAKMGNALLMVFNVVTEWQKKLEDRKILDAKAKEIPLRAIGEGKLIVVAIDELDPQLLSAVERVLGWGEQDPAVRVSFDDRGPGHAVLRRGDAPGWDFSVLANDPAVSFAHPGGFIFKTKERMSDEALFDLILRGHN